MKKRISCFILAAFMVVTTCFSGISSLVYASDQENTEVTKIDFANQALRFKLSQNDYGNTTDKANNTSAATVTSYNYWDKVLIYTSDTTSKTLKQAYANKANSGNTTFYNLWTDWGTYAVSLDQDSLDNAKKIVIPAGTEFPSYAYTTGATSTKKAYVTTKDAIFLKNGSAWEQQVIENTEVTKIDFANQALRFKLSQNDYGNTTDKANNASAATFTNYNYWDKVLIYTSDTTSKTLKQAYANKANSGNTTFYNLWTDWGTYAVSLDQDSLDNAKKIVIPAGTEFPSYAYTTGASTSKKSYVTTEDVTFKKSGGEWVKSSGGATIDELTSTPADGETVNLLQGGIYDFVTNYQKGTSEQHSTKNDCYAPAGVLFSWSEVTGATEYILEISNSESMIAPKTYKAASNTLTVDDLQAGKTYFYRIKVKDGDTYEDSAIFTFKTAQLPRTITIDGVSNTRDLGGYLTTDGKYRVRQSMVYRGANLEGITTQGKQEFLEKYGIKTDLDIRGDRKRSPLGNSVNYVTVVGPQYIQITDEQYQDALAKEIRTFADETNYPIYFHCQIGRDRTGTLAMLINALLGVSEQDIYMDYELSMFSKAGWADNTPVDELVNRHFSEAVEYIKGYQSGTLKENAEAFVKNELGITQAEIDTIRNILLEEAGNVSSYDTEINKIQVRGGKLIVFPETMDYASAANTTKLADKLDAYNILKSIVLYKSETEKTTLEEVYGGNTWYNVWGTANSIAFDLSTGWDGNTIKKVEFLPGAGLPSYAYTNDSATVKSVFVLRQETVFTTNTSADVNLDWTVEDNSTPERTTISRVKSGHNAQVVTFYLSNTDYDGLATAGIGAKHTDYNYLDQIKVYTDETNYVTLKDAYKADGQKYYNMWGEANTYSISLKDEYFANATRIVIPAGTVFPSSKYTNGDAAKKAGFTVKEEFIFEKPASGNDWSVVDTSEPDDTVVTKLLSGHNASILTFYLSASDYEKANQRVGDNHTDYNYLDQIRLYTDENNYKTLGEVCKAGGQILYNMWDRPNTYSIELDPTFYATIVKVVIPEGTVFPSSAHTNNGEAYKYGYVTKKDNTFGKPANATEGGAGYEWNSLNPAITYDTVVSKIQVRDVSGKLFLFLNNHDYSEAGSSIKIGAQLTVGNILDKIEVYRTDGVMKKLSEIYTGEGYYNLWGEQGCIALDMTDGWDGTNVEKVVIKPDCEFPSYAYTSGAIYDKTFYKTKYETIFTATAFGVNNVAFDQAMIIPSIPVSTTVLDATVLGAAEDMRLILTLSVQDYANAAESEACMRRILDYNTLSSIELCSGNDRISLADAVNTEEVYYNLWGRAGTVSYGLKPEYNVNSFDKIVVQSGCEFPAHSYTQSDTLDKTAYTVGTQQTINLTREKHTVSYYDQNQNLLYVDEVVSGTALSLRKAPARAGYEASWSGMTYTVMPTKDISYQLTYTKVAKEDTNTSGEDTTESNSEEQGSPSTGDYIGHVMLYSVLLMTLSAGVFVLIIKIKKNMRTEK